MDATAAIKWSNACFSRCYNASAEAKLKKWDLSVTADLFVRLRKTYAGGKQEYYSFNIRQFNDLDYLGTASAGTLRLKTDDDNIIQQTYNDPKGNEDNMVGLMSIPVKNMEPEKLDSLRMVLLLLKNK